MTSADTTAYNYIADYVKTGRINDTDSRRLINALIQDSFTIWQMLKIKPSNSMKQDLPLIIMEAWNAQGENPTVEGIMEEIRPFYVRQFRHALGLDI